MKKTTITKKELNELRKKAAKWDALGKQISKYFCDATGEYNEENPEQKGDLCDIGERAASAYGWM